ncbi:MAG: hypothetical protein K0B15_03085 [Lentimicrobium sp.]|nr:hypothetical protein [Lentimicrobium sp.]
MFNLLFLLCTMHPNKSIHLIKTGSSEYKHLMNFLWVCLLSAFGFLPFQGQSQIKDIGSPFINNYPKKIYRSSSQNWAIEQNSNGFMYFGNNDGLLEFDGKYWELYPMPKSTIIRSLLVKGDTIYAGAFEELGFYLPGWDGRMYFNSLSHLIPEYFRSFDEIWRIHNSSFGIIFQSFRYIFIFRDNQIKVIEPFSSFTQSFQVNGIIYIVDRKKGLMRLSERGLESVVNHPLFQETEIRSLFKISNGELLMGTSTEGIFIINEQQLIPWQSPVNEKLKNFELFSGIALSNNFMAFGTVQNGVFLTDMSGNIVQHLNRSKGLQNNTILSLFEDRHYNLWMGLDNGIDYAEISSPLSVFDFNFNLEATYASYVHNGKLYAGTNQGLFFLDISLFNKTAEKNHKFKLIPGTEGQVWSLQVFDGQLLCGHNTGCFLIDGEKATKISSIPGYWTFIRHRESSDTLIAGSYNGLSVFTKQKGSWTFSHEITGFKESSRTILQDDEKTIWVSHGYRGIYSLKINNNLTKVESVTLYKSSKGLPDELPYNIHLLDNELNITTIDGIYKYDRKGDNFYKNPRYVDIFAGLPFIDKITKDISGNYWFFTNTFMGVVRETERGKYSTELSPFYRINNMLLPSFENIYFSDYKNVFIGSQEGLIHYSPGTLDFRKRDNDPVFLRVIKFSSGDSTIYFTHKLSDKNQKKADFEEILLPFRFNSAMFRFSSPTFEYPEGTVFSFRLKGFENEWSGWESQATKEYTNLAEGDYTFMVKSKNAFNSESEVVGFNFKIRPPIHRSLAAKIFYSIILILIFAGNIFFFRRKIEKARQAEVIKHEKELSVQASKFREESLINEKEIIHLRNEALKNEMSHKTKELANTTLNLIHKTKILTFLKEQLVALQKSHKEQDQKFLLSQLIKKINKELKNEQHQEAFNTYFDDVHQDFILRLKDTHPSLTPKELRLCAYLRMNLSSKEIAPLMNISVRGLEISRYRLRKKLNIDHNVNLTDYILSV